MPCRFPLVLSCAAGLGLVAVAPGQVRAQDNCEFAPPTRSLVRTTIPARGAIDYVGGPHLLCDDGVEIWADSAVAYSDLNMQLLLGSVRYSDGTQELQADTARYFRLLGRLQAHSNLVLRDLTDGSEIRNGELVYLRVTDFRDAESMTVTTARDGIRPSALVPQAPSVDSTGATVEPGPPYTVTGDRIYLGGSSFAAAGTVEIEQDSLLAFADSADYDQDADELLLWNDARVLSGDNDLVGESIVMSSPAEGERRLEARRHAVLTGDGLLLTSPRIAIFLSDGELERLVAMPLAGLDPEVADSVDLARPIAVLENAELTADSLDIIAPGATVERVVAVGSARSVSTARDSLNTESLPEIARTDWLEGDTVVVVFLPVGGGGRRDAAVSEGSVAADSMLGIPPDSALAPPTPESVTTTLIGGTPPSPPEDGQEYEIDRVIATGTASALYRLAPADSAAVVGTDPPAVHYVVGDKITIVWVDGEVDGMEVVGQTRGVHMEPLAIRPEADSLDVSADSTGAVPDTSGVRPDTILHVPPRPSAVQRDEQGPRRRWSPIRREDPWKEEGP